ncbi:hypothetical protein BTVI_36361 [Pitangus sulphuratus]|nr:hypothetical protein BTVI_36361 [Pitangus sulphuratus]
MDNHNQVLKYPKNVARLKRTEFGQLSMDSVGYTNWMKSTYSKNVGFDALMSKVVPTISAFLLLLDKTELNSSANVTLVHSTRDLQFLLTNSRWEEFTDLNLLNGLFPLPDGLQILLRDFREQRLVLALALPRGVSPVKDLLIIRLNNPNSPSPSPEQRCSSPVISLVAYPGLVPTCHCPCVEAPELDAALQISSFGLISQVELPAIHLSKLDIPTVEALTSKLLIKTPITINGAVVNKANADKSPILQIKEIDSYLT